MFDRVQNRLLIISKIIENEQKKEDTTTTTVLRSTLRICFTFFFRFPKQKLLLHKKTLWHLFIDGLQLPQG